MLDCIGCLYAGACIFQTVGLFTTKWISNDKCDSVGLLYSCCGGPDNNTCRRTQGEDELDTSALGLQIVSLVLMWIGVLMFVVGIYCACGFFNKCIGKEKSWVTVALLKCCEMLFYYMIMFFGVLLLSISGILNISGCIVVATKFPRAQLGYSFYLCVIAGCYFLLMGVISCFAFCCDRGFIRKRLSVYRK
ncbi:uncharacterized protein LOC132760304 [Ruditapes philippinarum]|uniref:uncharacterized protein LOC132760304 n=1 Tax=Ruditapes philippinarum TaxID=129788 RepID=UPI00295B8B7E|nr:uncharacterized protein LOC132760304 [Ruditapes philippinarum]